MKKLAYYLNPVTRLGIRKYSFLFPLLFNISLCIVSEVYAYGIAKNPNSVGSYIIFLNVFSIIYFSFRDGIRGGVIAVAVTIFYYFYIIHTRGYTGVQWDTAFETTLILAALYLLLGGTIGWLKQRIDMLIGTETQARHLAEEGKIRLQTILDQLPVGVLLADVQEKKLEGNKQIEKILGKPIRGNLNRSPDYKSPYAYAFEKALSPKEWPIVRALVKGEIVNSEEIEFIRNDKKHLHLRVNAAPIRNKSNAILAAVSTIYDITQEKELEHRKDDFVNMASHELKTPITSMKLYIDLLKKRMTDVDERSEKIVDSIQKQTERLHELVNDLLDVSRIQTGKLHFRKEEFILNTLIGETIDVLQETTKNQQIIFTGKDTIFVYADRFRVYQVITNLLTNAIKYSPSGSNIIVHIQKMEGKIVVSVADKGIGIDPTQRTKIFERLYQVTDPKEKTFPGLGMGLYISKEIVKRHRGNIWVEGEKGKGSTFYFSLPTKKIH